ncbi:MAG TPA: PilZ domain-containing protein [Desulfomonilaceae bacterium]|nr:PilZ domain-containing protein [Desulfomonilaceae bacterium]
MSFSEKRKFTRIPFHTEIRITAGEITHVSHRLRDISLGGAFVVLSDSFPVAACCTLEIELVGPASLLRVEIDGEVVRAQEDGIAVKFTKIDLDSLLHLKHMIKVFTQDPELINEEFVSNLLELE